MPETPISDSAARTSSSLKGLMIALISFMGLWLLEYSARLARPGRRDDYAETVPGPSLRSLMCIIATPHHPGAAASPECPSLVRPTLPLSVRVAFDAIARPPRRQG